MRWIAIAFVTMAMLTAVPASAKNTLDPQISAGKDIVIKSVRIVVPSTGNLSGGMGASSQWYIVKFTYTNTTGHDFIPQLQKFMFQEPDATIQGAWTGTPDLIGVENPHQNDLLKVGESADYTLGFLLNSQVAGFVFYNPV